MTERWPDLTVVMPVRNEGPFMARSLGAVQAQDYSGTLEIIVADGSSTDETPEIVADAAAVDPRIRLIANPERIVSTGLNRAIHEAAGTLILRVDGHCEVPPSYASICVARLLEGGVDCVGGVLRTVGQSVGARAVALAQASRAGVGSAAFRTGAVEARSVDTVAFGVYRRQRLLELGGFDPELVRNQDDELNLRLIQDGGRILLEPDVEVTYNSRATLRGAARQYLQYGWFKPLVLRKRGRLPTARGLAPAALVLGLAVTTMGTALAVGLVGALAPIGAYVATLVIVGLWLGRRDPAAAPLVPVALAALHVPYGLGFLAGLWRWRGAPPTPVSVDAH